MRRPCCTLAPASRCKFPPALTGSLNSGPRRKRAQLRQGVQFRPPDVGFRRGLFVMLAPEMRQIMPMSDRKST